MPNIICTLHDCQYGCGSFLSGAAELLLFDHQQLHCEVFFKFKSQLMVDLLVV